MSCLSLTPLTSTIRVSIIQHYKDITWQAYAPPKIVCRGDYGQSHHGSTRNVIKPIKRSVVTTRESTIVENRQSATGSGETRGGPLQLATATETRVLGTAGYEKLAAKRKGTLEDCLWPAGCWFQGQLLLTTLQLNSFPPLHAVVITSCRIVSLMTHSCTDTRKSEMYSWPRKTR